LLQVFDRMKTKNTLAGVVYDSTIHNKGELIHEHDFVRAGTKETNAFLVRCASCGIHLCDRCGKVLENITQGFCNEKI
jgi:hypothetical protein